MAVSPDGATVYVSNGSAASISVIAVSSSNSNSNSDSDSELSTPGILLTVTGRAAGEAAGSEVLFGAYAAEANTPYVVQRKPASASGGLTVLETGRTDFGGHLEEETTLPQLPSGTNTVIFTTRGPLGQILTLGNNIVVSPQGTIISITPEALQPTIR